MSLFVENRACLLDSIHNHGILNSSRNIEWITRKMKGLLTLFGPAYFGISGTGGGHIVPPLSILGLGGVRVPILFGNDLPMND